MCRIKIPQQDFALKMQMGGGGGGGIFAGHYGIYVQPLSPAVSLGNELFNTNSLGTSSLAVVKKYLYTCAY